LVLDWGHSGQSQTPLSPLPRQRHWEQAALLFSLLAAGRWSLGLPPTVPDSENSIPLDGSARPVAARDRVDGSQDQVQVQVQISTVCVTSTATATSRQTHEHQKICVISLFRKAKSVHKPCLKQPGVQLPRHFFFPHRFFTAPKAIWKPMTLPARIFSPIQYSSAPGGGKEHQRAALCTHDPRETFQLSKEAVSSAVPSATPCTDPRQKNLRAGPPGCGMLIAELPNRTICPRTVHILASPRFTSALAVGAIRTSPAGLASPRSGCTISFSGSRSRMRLTGLISCSVPPHPGSEIR